MCAQGVCVWVKIPNTQRKRWTYTALNKEQQQEDGRKDGKGGNRWKKWRKERWTSDSDTNTYVFLFLFLYNFSTFCPNTLTSFSFTFRMCAVSLWAQSNIKIWARKASLRHLTTLKEHNLKIHWPIALCYLNQGRDYLFWYWLESNKDSSLYEYYWWCVIVLGKQTPLPKNYSGFNVCFFLDVKSEHVTMTFYLTLLSSHFTDNFEHIL